MCRKLQVKAIKFLNYQDALTNAGTILDHIHNHIGPALSRGVTCCYREGLGRSKSWEKERERKLAISQWANKSQHSDITLSADFLPFLMAASCSFRTFFCQFSMSREQSLEQRESHEALELWVPQKFYFSDWYGYAFLSKTQKHNLKLKESSY